VAYLYRDNYSSNEVDIPHNSQECCHQHVAVNAVGDIGVPDAVGDIGVPDVITHANLGDNRFRGSEGAGVEFPTFPLTCVVILEILWHYRASM